MEDNKQIVLGADIGGSHITTALIDLGKNQLIHESVNRLRVDSNASAKQIINDWVISIQKTLECANLNIDKVGLAMPGPFDYKNGISKMKSNAKFEALYNLNVKNALAELLDLPPTNIKMMNDAGCFLKGEAFCGVAKEYNDVIGVTLGTGLGTAKYHDGVGEDADLWDIKFKNGIAEDYISTRWFVNRYFEITGKQIKDVKALAELYNTHEFVPQIFDEFGDNLSEFLLSFVLAEKPELVVIGGNISKVYSLFKNKLEEKLFENNKNLVIKISSLGEHAALIGAASLWSNS